MANRQNNRLRLTEFFYDSSTVVRIVNLLFATTLVTFFAYILFYVAVGQAGNGGEYWGYDGLEEPYAAAIDAFNSRDYRFLHVRFNDTRSGHVDLIPGVKACSEHPFAPENHLRLPLLSPMHGPDSVKLATRFARRFNSRMASLLYYDQNVDCEPLYGF